MNKLLTISFWAVMAVAAAAQAAPPPDLMARIHFAGAGRISADANATAFTNEFCSAEARALESQTLDKLSRAPAAWFRSKIPPGAGDGATQLRPLLDDLLKSEWVFEMRDAGHGSPEYALAIRLNDQRAQLWQKNLQNLLESWTKISAQKVPGGWELRKHEPPNLLRFTRATADWVVVDCGQDQLTLADNILGPFSQTKMATGESNWLTADLDWPRLGRLFPALARFDFPKLELQCLGRDGNLRLNGRFILARPLPALESWRVPTNAIHQPFTSFTAVRGIGPWLMRQSWAQRYEIQPPPNQFFFWALPQIPFQTFAAAPVPDANAALAQLDAKLSPGFNNKSPNPSLPPMAMELTNNEITWHGIPFFAPFVQTLHEPAGEFLYGGFFPNTPRGRPLPPELWQQLHTPNLVYYHWEITAERLKELPELTQLMLMITRHKQLDVNSPAGKWLNRIGPSLGNSVTEILQSAPNELTFTRKSPGGLTALELIALANWLEATNFPGCDLSLPFIHRRRPPPRTTNPPTAQTPMAPPPAHRPPP